MKKISVLTATRAEYGLLKPLITGLINCGDFDVEVVVTGAHLSPEFGLTYKEIENDCIPISAKIPILLSSDSPSGVSKAMGLALIGFADYFEQSKPDLLIVLGDRYETAAVCAAATNARIPVAHLHGGETTEGAVDEAYRHAITKMSYLHFTATESYRKRVIQLGEDPSRVYNVGAIGVENALHSELLTLEELGESLGIALDVPYACVTFHPVTLEEETAEEQVKELFSALKQFPDMKFLITKANADAGGRIINRIIDESVAENSNFFAFTSLGVKRYLSAVKYSSVVIGNSSSGLLEVPSFKVPTVNIGDRQKGHIEAESVIDVAPIESEICSAVKKALSSEFKKKCESVKNPYGDGDTSSKIIRIVSEMLKDNIVLKKSFYDVEYGL